MRAFWQGQIDGRDSRCPGAGGSEITCVAPARLGDLDPGEVRAHSVPAAGGACREDGRITAAAPDVENVLPVLDLRGGEQPRRQPAPHPLMPLTLLDELPPAGSVPVLGLLRIHRHEGHATSPRNPARAVARCAVRYVLAGDRDGPEGKPERGLRAAARVIDAATDRPE